MAITNKKDVWKVNFTKSETIWLMASTAAVLLFFIISNLVWMTNYDHADIIKKMGVKNNGAVDTDAFVRFRVLVSIVTNTLVLGLFAGLVWWGNNKKRYGFVFGGFWLVIFGGNAIGLFFYVVQIDWMTIITSIMYACISIALFRWIVMQLAHRSRLKDEIARKRRINR